MIDIVHAVSHGNHHGIVHGKVYTTGTGEGKHIVSLKGMINATDIPFEASFVVDHEWNGEGGFSYGHTHVEHAKVKGISV